MTTAIVNPGNANFNALPSNNKDQWKEQRLSTITATDAAKLWTSPTPATYRAIAESKEKTQNIPSTKAFEHGHEREPEIIRQVAEYLNLDSDLYQNELLWVNSKNSRYGATPDGFGADKDSTVFNGILLECKTHNTRMGGKSFEEVPHRGIRYFEKDEDGIYRETVTGEVLDGKIPELHEGQMRWQRVTAGGNVKGQKNWHYYATESHENFDPATFELTIIKVEFTDDELEEIIDAVEDYLAADKNYKVVSQELDDLILKHEEFSVLEKYFKEQKEAIKNQIRERTGAGVAEVAFELPVGKITSTYKISKALDKERLEKEHPGLIEKYTNVTESDRPVLNVTPGKSFKSQVKSDVYERYGFDATAREVK